MFHELSSDGSQRPELHPNKCLRTKDGMIGHFDESFDGGKFPGTQPGGRSELSVLA